MGKVLKKNKFLKYIAMLCMLIIFVEIVYIIYAKFKVDNNTIYYDLANSIALIDDGYLTAGSSDFKYSNHNKYTNGYEKGKLVKYNSDNEIIMELKYNKGYNSSFLHAIKVNDGYIAVGSVQKDMKQVEANIRDALIVKYDLSGKIIWENTFQVLDDAKFNKVIEVSDGYVVVGRSIYEMMIIGNETTGGAIIAKYDFDGNLVWSSNLGGNKSGLYNDVISINDGFIAVGKDAKNTGIISKYDFNGNRIWTKNYSFTDNMGFSAVSYHNDMLYVAGSKTIDDNDTDGLIVKYDLSGNFIAENTLKMEGFERFNDLGFDGDYVVTIGHTTYTEKEKSTRDAFIVKYDLQLNKVWQTDFKGTHDEYFTGLAIDNDYFVTGYSNSNDYNVKNKNNKDFFVQNLKYNKDGKLVELNGHLYK